MLPHSSCESGTGAPSVLRQRTAPVAASSALTWLDSVATISIARGAAITSGCA